MGQLHGTIPSLTFQLGVKTDPILYRYSYEWLFKLLQEEDIHHIQLGTFFEMYDLPDGFFRRLAALADEHNIRISSVFTSHRELGGLFIDDPDWHAVARRKYRRLIEIGALVGARSVGSNPGATLRDRHSGKADGIRRYLDHMKEASRYARTLGLEALTIEPMSCLAEPPTTPGEIASFALELHEDNERFPDETVPVRYCADISHGHADADGRVHTDNYAMLEACLPHLQELHLRNTDALFDKTFGFTPSDRATGIVKIDELRRFIQDRAFVLPNRNITGYFEISGPKLGRDYTDSRLEEQLRSSLSYLKETFTADPARTPRALRGRACPGDAASRVKVAPSVMCADMRRLGEEVKRLEMAGADLLHFDIMDGHFVPNMPLGLSVIAQLRNQTSLPFEVHLMVDDNEFFIGKLLEMGVESISIHAESSQHLDRSLSAIRSGGAKAGVALNPATPLDTLSYVTERFDYVLLMTVNPGFAGQAIVPSALRKIADCRDFLRTTGVNVPIEADGNVSFEAIPDMVAAGANVLVAGTSSVFRAGGTYRENMATTHERIAAGLAAKSKASSVRLVAAR
ncbi:MAG: ribulose-phosphate 3-epimerase [Capsulimonadaceae bacterium]|nr:ribulose-phosphate 3-epimerase [Capsulimonadaceae bacterium]